MYYANTDIEVKAYQAIENINNETDELVREKMARSLITSMGTEYYFLINNPSKRILFHTIRSSTRIIKFLSPISDEETQQHIMRYRKTGVFHLFENPSLDVIHTYIKSDPNNIFDIPEDMLTGEMVVQACHQHYSESSKYLIRFGHLVNPNDLMELRFNIACLKEYHHELVIHYIKTYDMFKIFSIDEFGALARWKRSITNDQRNELFVLAPETAKIIGIDEDFLNENIYDLTLDKQMLSFLSLVTHHDELLMKLKLLL